MEGAIKSSTLWGSEYVRVSPAICSPITGVQRTQGGVLSTRVGLAHISTRVGLSIAGAAYGAPCAARRAKWRTRRGYNMRRLFQLAVDNFESGFCGSHSFATTEFFCKR